MNCIQADSCYGSGWVMGFSDQLREMLGEVIETRFEGLPSRLAKKANATTTRVQELQKGTKSTWLDSLGRVMDAAGIRPALGTSEDEYAFVPRVEARPAAGGGSLEMSGRSETSLAFRREWLATKTTTPGKLVVMSVMGDSMHPTISGGDLVLVDEGARALQEGRVYVVRLDGELFIKRYFKGPGRHFFRGDNRERAFEDIETAHSGGPEWEVIGRVLWAGKEL